MLASAISGRLDGNDISGADEATFELTQAQVGATITVTGFLYRWRQHH